MAILERRGAIASTGRSKRDANLSSARALANSCTDYNASWAHVDAHKKLNTCPVTSTQELNTMEYARQPSHNRA
eukprot:1131625-Pleurochrysis_carterae.AAC.1